MNTRPNHPEENSLPPLMHICDPKRSADKWARRGFACWGPRAYDNELARTWLREAYAKASPDDRWIKVDLALAEGSLDDAARCIAAAELLATCAGQPKTEDKELTKMAAMLRCPIGLVDEAYVRMDQLLNVRGMVYRSFSDSEAFDEWVAEVVDLRRRLKVAFIKISRPWVRPVGRYAWLDGKRR